MRRAHLNFLSAAPGSNIVGATASTLLMLDEAQDIEPAKYDKQIAPMAASTNATRVFWGTAWTSQTLLARELRLAEAAQAEDGIRRVFQIGSEEVRREVPAYGLFVDEQVARLGRQNPLVRSQLFSEEIDLSAGLFNAQRLGLMMGSHKPLEGPEPDRQYAMLIDLAGEDEALRSGIPLDGDIELANTDRDSTAITIVEADLSLMGDALAGRPRYKVVQRVQWTGEKHANQYQRILALHALWQPVYVVVDASGVGAGLASFLADRLGNKLIPLYFTAKLKSELGWGFLSVIDTGRFAEFRSGSFHEALGEPANPLAAVMRSEQEGLQALFLRQLLGIVAEASIGPEHHLRWAVPETATDPIAGGRLHDDLVLSASMVAVLDKQSWSPSLPAVYIPALDPIMEMDGGSH